MRAARPIIPAARAPRGDLPRAGRSSLFRVSFKLLRPPTMNKATPCGRRLAALSLLLFALHAAAFAQTRQPTRGLSVQDDDRREARPDGPQSFHALALGINNYHNLK